MMVFSDRPKCGIHCPHCGKWHYGKGTIQETVDRDAARRVANCKRERHILGLHDERPDLLEVGK